MKRLMVVLMVAGMLAVFEGMALAQSAPQGTEQTVFQGTEQTAPQGTLDAKSLDDDASVGPGVAGPAETELPRNGKILFNSRSSGTSGYELQTMNPDGSNRASFTPPINGVLAMWSPDGTKFAFRVLPGFSIAIASADGTGQTDVPNIADESTQFIAQSTGRPIWSPDGTKLAYLRDGIGEIFDEDTNEYRTIHLLNDIYTINVDGTEKAGLRKDYPIDQDTGAGAFSEPLSWSPDGAKIAFTLHNPDSLCASRREIYTIDADGTGQPTRLPNPACGPAPSSPAGLAWSPDGSEIAFIGSNQEVNVMNADGTEQRRVTTDGTAVREIAPQWSPDGTKLIFSGRISSQLTSGQVDIFTINVDGSNRTNLTNTPGLSVDEVAPTWAPAPPDSTKPITTATPLPPPNDSGWHNSDVKVTLSAEDQDGSGVEKITYSASGAQTIEQKDASGSSVEVTLDQEGTTALSYFATDKAGNAEDQKTLTVKIDKTSPAVSSTNPANNATGVAATANISATFSESGSGIDLDTFTNSTFQVVQLKPTGNVPVSSGTFSLLENSEGSQTVTFDPESSLAKGAYRVTITGVADNAGNALANDYTWQFATAGPSKKQ